MMKNLSVLLAAASATLLVASAAFPASALDLNVGGKRGVSVKAGSSDNGGTRVGATVGRSSVGATLGGNRNIASTSVSTGRNTVGANVGANGGRVVSLNSRNGTTTGNVNLGLGNRLNRPLNSVSGTVGGILDGVNPRLPGVPGTPGAPGGGVTSGGVAGAIDGMSSGQVAALQTQCGQILNNPRRFDRDLVSLCMILQRL